MRNAYLRLMLVALAWAISSARSAQAHEGCCSCCGGCCECCKTCRLVCEEKTVDVVCWGCVCEDFCLPKHDKACCVHCETVCAKCGEPHDPKAPCVQPKRFLWTEWCPGCATMHSKKKLMKKTEKVTVKTFKWVVEDLCPKCKGTCDVAEAGPEDKVPDPPKVAGAELLYKTK